MADAWTRNSETTPPPVADDTTTRVFLEHRELLFSIVYNMLGLVTDTEDVLQDTWMSWAARSQRPGAAHIDHTRAYLVRVAVNKALAQRATIDRRRETYVGQWLPEPVLTAVADAAIPDDAADMAMRAESSSMALLVVLETLTPAERAVFVLHEVFGYAHTEIADILGRSPAAVRQLAHRARGHVHARRPRYRTDPHLRRKVTERFITAARGGDLEALLEVLAPDVTLWTDGGGKGPATSLQPIQGRDEVARTLVAVASNVPETLTVGYRRVNGDPSAVLFDRGAPFAVLVVDLSPDEERIRRIYSITNPDKLSAVGRP